MEKTLKLRYMLPAVISIATITTAAIVLNFFPDKVGVITSATDLSSFRPMLTPAFQIYLPWLNLLWGMAIVLNVACLLLGSRTPAIEWVDLVLCIFGAILLGWMALGVSFIADVWLSLLVRFVLGLAGLFALLGAGQQFSHLNSERRILGSI